MTMKHVISLAVVALLGRASEATAQNVTRWARVSLAEKDDVWMIPDGGLPIRRVVRMADAEGVTVLNDALPVLDPHARRDLREMARAGRSPAHPW